MAVAEASFKISMLSISLGLIKFIGLEAPPAPKPRSALPELLSPDDNGTPSITYKGSAPALTELKPLIVTEDLALGSPLAEVICTPAAFPCNNCSGDVLVPLLKSSAFTDDRAPVASFFLVKP